MQLRREKLDVNTWSHLAVRTPPCRFQQSAALAPLFGALGTGNANGERWSDSGAKVPRKIKGPKFWSRLLSRHSLCSQNSVFSNSGIGVGFSMTVLISFVSVWSGRKKGFLLKKFSQRSVKGSLTC